MLDIRSDPHDYSEAKPDSRDACDRQLYQHPSDRVHRRLAHGQLILEIPESNRGPPSRPPPTLDATPCKPSPHPLHSSQHPNLVVGSEPSTPQRGGSLTTMRKRQYSLHFSEVRKKFDDDVDCAENWFSPEFRCDDLRIASTIAGVGVALPGSRSIDP